MIEGQLIARRVNHEPRGYRMIFDNVEIGAISQDLGAQGQPKWHWGVDPMPLLHRGNSALSGDAATFQTALDEFKRAFFDWVNTYPLGDWQRNRDFMRPAAKQMGL